jgi:hypothetical protein
LKYQFSQVEGDLHLQTPWKNNIALIIFQCCLIVTRCNATTCVITLCMAIIKTRANNILCLN